jgi:hypothetical protein
VLEFADDLRTARTASGAWAKTKNGARLDNTGPPFCTIISRCKIMMNTLARTT